MMVSKVLGARRALTLAVVVAIGAAGFAGCGDDNKPSASEWRADAVKLCERNTSTREATAKATGAVDGSASVEQVLAFYAAFTPQAEAVVKDLKALKQPAGLDAEFDEWEAAMDSVLGSMKAMDRAAVEAEIATGNNTGDYARFEAANAALGIPECSQ